MQTVDNEEKRISEERQAFWTSVYPDWPFWTQSQRKKAKNMYKNKLADKCNSCVPVEVDMAIGMQWTRTYDYAQMCYTTAVQKKEEDAMTENQIAKDRLLRRLRTAYHEKIAEARKTFFMVDDNPPKDGAELIARITAGKFIFDKDAETAWMKSQGYVYSSFQFITWRDPATPANEAGFEAFVPKLDAAFENANDEVAVKDPVAGLDTLRAFQTLTIA